VANCGLSEKLEKDFVEVEINVFQSHPDPQKNEKCKEIQQAFEANKMDLC
jgi:hypothetical protein